MPDTNERLAVVETDVKWIKEALTVVVARTRFLEKWQWKLTGISAGVSALVGGIIAILKYL